MKKVRKAIIPAAGYGTRFLPATKALPKEMLPIIDTPTIQYIVEEAVKAGASEAEVAAALATAIALNAGAAYTYSLRALEAYSVQKA